MAKRKESTKLESTYLDNFDIKESLSYCPEPTYHFEIGDKLSVGNLKNPIVVEKYENGKVYKIHYTHVNNNYGNPIETEKDGFWMWHDLRPKNTNEEHNIIKNKDFRLSYSQRTISGLFTTVYHFGLDTSPSYQREYVWTEDDKVLLIDSIFHNVDIGKFTFVHLDNYNVGEYGYEIMDGKQRLKALTDFYENRFAYKGLYYNDLNNFEKHHFLDYNVSYAELRDVAEEDKYRIFILLNTAGKPVDVEQIDNVKRMYKKKTGEELD